MQLEKMSIRQLIELYNAHSGTEPIRSFRDKRTAIERVRAVLPKERTTSRAAPDLDVSMFAEPTHIDALATLLGTSPKGARSYIDRARRLGHNIVNVGRGTFALG